MSIWVPIQGFPEYSVNSFGEVKHDVFDRLMTPHANQTNVVYVSLSQKGHQYQRALARIVANTFLDPPLPPFDTPINLDGDRWNCAADNLMWRPRWFAILYHHQFKEPYHKPIRVPVRPRGENEIFRDSLAAAMRYGLLERDVALSVTNNTYTWPNYLEFELVP